MWPAIVNRQPFFFPDTTSYVRAADIAVYMASKGHVSTEWTDRYRTGLKPHKPTAAPKAAAAAPRAGNDVGSGNIMSGRSPYFGALLYLGYVTSDFWLFVLAQAAIAFWLIHLSLTSFALSRNRWVLPGMVAFLALATSLPIYNSLLLADALTGFGMVALLLLAVDRQRLGRFTRLGLVVLMLVSSVSHLTHILILLTMTATLALICLARRRLWPVYRYAIVAGTIAVAVGLVSVSLTSLVIAKTFKQPPQLVPLLTSRMIEEGPGGDFIRAGCPGARFAICAIPEAAGLSAQDFLWSTEPHRGVFMLVDPATRRKLSDEDTRFALAVLRAYPLESVGGMVRGTIAQLTSFRNGSLEENCFRLKGCWSALPDRQREHLRGTPAGRGIWPTESIDLLHHVVVIGSLILILVFLPAVVRPGSVAAGDLGLWLLLILVGMLANAVLGGAVSIPQYRYQGRIIWLVPFCAALLLLVARQSAGIGAWADWLTPSRKSVR